jgi:hypothetical protein
MFRPALVPVAQRLCGATVPIAGRIGWLSETMLAASQMACCVVADAGAVDLARASNERSPRCASLQRVQLDRQGDHEAPALSRRHFDVDGVLVASPHERALLAAHLRRKLKANSPRGATSTSSGVAPRASPSAWAGSASPSGSIRTRSTWPTSTSGSWPCHPLTSEASCRPR